MSAPDAPRIYPDFPPEKYPAWEAARLAGEDLNALWLSLQLTARERAEEHESALALVEELACAGEEMRRRNAGTAQSPVPEPV